MGNRSTKAHCDLCRPLVAALSRSRQQKWREPTDTGVIEMQLDWKLMRAQLVGALISGITGTACPLRYAMLMEGAESTLQSLTQIYSQVCISYPVPLARLCVPLSRSSHLLTSHQDILQGGCESAHNVWCMESKPGIRWSLHSTQTRREWNAERGLNEAEGKQATSMA